MESWIADRALACGVDLVPGAIRLLAIHVQRVFAEAEALHLTSIRAPGVFFERHVGESLEGAALIPRGTLGAAFDLGSGNGYPAIPIAAAHPGLRIYLAEVSRRKAAFLRSVVESGLPNAVVLERHVQRATDIADLPPLGVITARAVGGWGRVLPRLAPKLESSGRIMVWAGSAADEIAGRVAWRGLALEHRRELPGRTRSWIFVYSKKQTVK